MSEPLKECVVIEDRAYHDQVYGFTVWADPDNADVIRNIEGVTYVYVWDAVPTRYSVYIDHRYDASVLKESIKKALGG